MHTERIILIGGCFLAFGAAFANMGVFLDTGTSVSHLTGDISKLSTDLVNTSPEIFSELIRVAAATASFFLGAFLAGLFIHHPSLDFARPYGRTIVGIGVLFTIAHFLIPSAPVAAISLSALGCGLQNALATRYRGIVLRTTHLTGLITDFGITLGMRFKKLDIPTWKIAVPAVLTAAFFAGGVCSAIVFWQGDHDPVLIAGLAYVAAGLAWTFLKHIVWPWLDPGKAPGDV